MNDEEVNAFLEHYGVKGMKWGVRKASYYTPKGGSKSKGGKKESNDPMDDPKVYADQVRRKYGPQTSEKLNSEPRNWPGWDDLSPNQKKVVIAAGGALLVGGALYFGNRYGLDNHIRSALAQGLQELDLDHYNFDAQKAADELMMNIPDSVYEMNKDTFLEIGKGLDPFVDYTDGVKTHWNHGVSLKPGSVLQRLSTKKESTIRDSGFFAAYKDSDITRYKARLPKYWKDWGLNKSEGYLTKIKAKQGIRAPDGETSIKIFKKLIDDDARLKQVVGPKLIKTLTKEDRETLLEGLAKANFANFSLHWANGMDKDPDVQQYFKLVKNEGFNALIDFNDAGRLAETPLRILTGDGFDISGHEFVSKSDIAEAIAAVGDFAIGLEKTDIVMAIRMHGTLAEFLSHHGVKMQIDEETYLEHYGVKGMKWGVRRDRSVSRSTNREARKDAKEAARAKMYYGQGAGNRRKLINKSVEAKRKRDSSYGKAFDEHFKRELDNLDTHAAKARKQRKRTDRADTAKKSAGQVARRLTGEMGTVAAFTAAATAGAAYLNSPQGRQKASIAVAKVKVALSSLGSSQPKAADWLKSMGIKP